MTRVVSRLFIPGQELIGGSESRAANTVERVMALSDDDVDAALADLFHRFDRRHEDLAGVFDMNAERVVDYVTSPMTRQRRRLLGAAFTHEYSLEGASVCNPSLVAHPDQRFVAEGALRIVMSVRAVGEGHHSSICFRTGQIDVRGELCLDDAQTFPVVGTVDATQLNGELFRALLHDLGYDDVSVASVLNGLGDTFSPLELASAVIMMQNQTDTQFDVAKIAGLLGLIASCFYHVSFDHDVDLSRRVLWPASPTEANGMEDARFVAMNESGVANYIASYTAFDGHSVSQQLLETDDFVTFNSSPLAGRAARNKGLAFFPRKVDGRFAALSRFDRESNAVAFSSNIHVWNDVVTAQVPLHPWEVVQLGNCGSPIELNEGWLVMTHGVGPMRTYGIGALLLDLDDPTIIIGQLPRPLLVPTKEEQDGYVPNVVYSCGSLVHAGTLHIPYGIADQSISCASVPVADIVNSLERVTTVGVT